jgi:predicted transcriptional regulator YheO
MLGGFVGPLAEALGQDTEIVLHDLNKMPNSIVALGGKLTGRSIGGPITDLLLRHIKQGKFDNLLRYRTQSRGGRVLRSSTIFVKDSSGRPVACLCINTDLTEWSQAHDLLGRFISAAAPADLTGRLDVTEEDGVNGENFAQTVEELTVTTVRDVIARIGVSVELMQKQHKFEVVRQLDERGFFLIRDAVDYVAEALGVTRYTIYNYLSDLKSTGDTGPQAQRRATSRRLPLRRHLERRAEL